MYLARCIRESSPNAGFEVEHFQKTVDGKAAKESWCAAFVCTILNEVAVPFGVPHIRFSEHCLSMWNWNTLYQQKFGGAGFIAIWRNKDGSGRGHTGICESAPTAGGDFFTIEGNTSGQGMDTDGDGVYRCKRNTKGFANFQLVGFLDPWTTNLLGGRNNGSTV